MFEIEAASFVLHQQEQARGVVPRPDSSGLCMSVADHVGQGFLDNAIRGGLNVGVKAAAIKVAVLESDTHPGDACTLLRAVDKRRHQAKMVQHRWSQIQ